MPNTLDLVLSLGGVISVVATLYLGKRIFKRAIPLLLGDIRAGVRSFLGIVVNQNGKQHQANPKDDFASYDKKPHMAEGKHE